jgi:hypothetical protein
MSGLILFILFIPASVSLFFFTRFLNSYFISYVFYFTKLLKPRENGMAVFVK